MKKTIYDLIGFEDICASEKGLSAGSGQCWNSGATETGYAMQEEMRSSEENWNRAQATVGLAVSKA